MDTDNNPLCHLGTVEQRWASQLAYFNLQFHYHSAALSRQYTEYRGITQQMSNENEDPVGSFSGVQ